MQLRWISLGIVGLAAVAWGAWWWSRSPSPELSQDTLSSSSWQTLEVDPWILVRGQQLRYRLHYSGYLPEAPRTQQELALTGQLTLTVLDELESHYRVRLSFDADALSSTPSVWPPGRGESFRQRLQEGVAVALGQRGFDLSLDEQQPMDPLLHSFWQALIDRTRAVVPALLPDHRYTWEESLTGLPIEAVYDVDRSLGPADVRRESVYVHKSFRSQEGAARILDGESLMMLRPGFEGIERLDFQGTEYLQVGAQKIAATSELSLRWEGEERVAEADLLQMERQLEVEYSKGEETLDRESQIQANAMGHSRWPDLWQAMQRLSPHEKLPQDLYLRLKAWIRLKPEELAVLYDGIKDRPADDPLLRLGIKALAGVGNEAAQQVLVQLLEHRREDHPLAKRLITQLGLMPVPSLAAEAALVVLIDLHKDRQLTSSSHLALGMMALRLSQQESARDRERAKALEQRAWRLLSEKPRHSNWESDALAMLGNLGPSDIAPLRPYLASQDPEKRSKAYFTLRFARDSHTPHRLVAFFRQEAAATARKQILQALDLRPADRTWFAAVNILVEEALSREEQLSLARAIVRKARLYRQESFELLSKLEQKVVSDEPLQRTLSGYRQQISRQKEGVF